MGGNNQTISIDIVKDGFGGVNTRSTTTGLVTTITSGDAAGVYALDASNKVVAANVKATYNGSSWSLASAIPYSTSYKYYAYFPYVSSPSGGPAVGNTMSSSDINTVFSSLKSNWTVYADQSSAANFIKSDLCIGTGTHASNGNISFVLSHVMGLFVGDGSQTRYKLTSGNDYYFLSPHTTAPTFSGNIPMTKGSTYYYIVKPLTDVTIASETVNIPSGSFVESYFEKNFTLELGDIVYSDGSISHQSQDLIPGRDVSGVVVYVSDTSNPNNSAILENRTHGLVMDNVTSGSGTGLMGVSGSNFPEISSYEDAVVDFKGIAKTNEAAATEWKTQMGPDVWLILNTSFVFAKNYSKSKPVSSTQWFIASIGQWIAAIKQIQPIAGGDPISSSNWITGFMGISQGAAPPSNALASYLGTISLKAGGSNDFTQHRYFETSSLCYNRRMDFYYVNSFKVEIPEYEEARIRCFFAF